MGLDMYLTAERYISEYEPTGKLFSQQVADLISPEVGALVKDAAECSMVVRFTIGYWRKANAIHKWFVKNVQEGEDDCNRYFVSEEQLNELLGICQKVLLVGQPVAGEKYLPPGEGLCFDSIHYNSHYWEQIRRTIVILKRALALGETDGNFMIYYRSSW